MRLRDTFDGVPSTRVAMLLPYVGQLDLMGAPVGRLLWQAGIPEKLLECPAAAVPLETAFRFGELACRAAGTEHLGAVVGTALRLDDLGSYGLMLKDCLTLSEYFRKGIALYNMLTTGQRLWLSEHGDEFVFHVATPGPPGVAAYQSELATLIVTVARCKEVAWPNWSPREISLAYRSRESLPALALFAGSRILRGTGQTWFTVPRSLMELPLPGRTGGLRGGPSDVDAVPRLPETLVGLVQLQIAEVLHAQVPEVHFVADTLGLSPRSLQRGLANEGRSFSQLIADARAGRAAEWLRGTSRSVADIAHGLGYTDASNFTRAFRKRTGVTPQRFRAIARRRLT